MAASSPLAALTTAPADPLAPESLRLAAALWAELSTIYPEQTAPPFPPRDIAGERAVLLLASLGENAIGCGAIRPFPGGPAEVAEIKRMYVAPEARRRGVSRTILQRLEEWARAHDYTIARLETGSRQKGAITLYEQAGYSPIARYGHHVADPLAVCFEKQLAGAAKETS